LSENILKQLAIFVERGKENKTSPYPPDLKDMDGVREVTQKILDTGTLPDEIQK